MRLTLTVLGRAVTKHKSFKRMWNSKTERKEYPFRPPQPLTELGIPVIDPLQEQIEVRNQGREEWKPPVENDLRFWTPPKQEERPDYHEKEAFSYNSQIRLLEGLTQACELTKTQTFDGLPNTVQSLIGKIQIPDEETHLQKIILNSQVWDATSEKLPKRIDTSNVMWKFSRKFGIPRKKSVSMILSDLVRLCQTVACQFPSAVFHRQLIPNTYLGTHFYYNDDLINITGMQECLLTSREYLPPFFDEEAVRASSQNIIPTIFPIFPTINCVKQNCYTVQDFPAMKTKTGCTKPHTIFIRNNDLWPNKVRQSRALMFAFGYAVSHARSLYGNVKELPQPVCVQCVNMDETTLNFLFFQLNTMDLGTKDGVKNLAWLDTENRLYRKHLSKPWKGSVYKRDSYDSFDAEPFHKLLATVLHGIPDLKNV